MRKLESDIKRATKRYERAKAEYEKARDALQSLVELKEVERMDEQGVKPNLVNVMQYGSYLHGIQMACNKIRNDWFKGDSANNLDKETGCYHIAQVAWNAIAMLHFKLKEYGNELQPPAWLPGLRSLSTSMSLRNTVITDKPKY